MINEDIEEASRSYGSFTMPGTQDEKSALFVPLVIGEQARGLINLINLERENAFSESDVRLLQTLANSMSVALENARLFDETQRLFKESEQRAAELAVINSIQQGVAAELDFQAIVDLVGDKLREVFRTGDIGIRWHDPATNLLNYLYQYEHGVRQIVPATLAAPGGAWERLSATRQTLVMHTQAEAAALGIGVIPGTDDSQSAVFVPILSGDRMLGTIVLEDYERENAFGESEVRLLDTVAASMGVALENARLFNETQRLLKETEQRAAELSIINSVQEGLASKLDMQAIYDLVGDKIREIFDAQVLAIVTHDAATNLLRYRYVIERGQRLHPDPVPFGDKGFTPRVIRTRQPILVNSDMDRHATEVGSSILAGEPVKSALFVPLLVGDEARGIISLQNLDRENAFSESDVRLLQTLANSMSVALENARLFDETQRRTRETAALAEVGRDISSTLDLATVMDRIARHAKELLGGDNSAIFLPDADGRSYHAIVAVGEIAPLIQATHIEVGVGIIGSLVQSGQRRVHQRYGRRPARRADRRHQARERRTADGRAAQGRTKSSRA